MSQNNLKEKIINVLKNSKIGTLSTIRNNKPYSRYMTFFNDNLTLFTPTSIQTDKADEIKANPNVHVLVGYEGEGFGDPYVEIEGTASINDSVDLKEKLWNKNMEPWFDGPNDSNLIVLEIKPDKITLMNTKENSPRTLDL
ncbi:pyridoxamine 5'-phosphate oxidase family protein [Bacillus sp. CMF12]|uniref:pyridoxamine 5'-phosphate oxidase family protein n=1 Tax=Bacillaceae TaxID=186817 RepID=UPI00207A0D96|nr:MULTISPECIES: pyridoxamine 5'-phosphate oxidase family protein [Bacillaceae]MDF2039402.1 pyridoxamine 5'-phosphate oxidase family protein [Cytobacillus oceanisediminis]USK51352.1 pyridoxamine 5'-phosphate oxidase family protein [Bacillus sp. CMF12]